MKWFSLIIIGLATLFTMPTYGQSPFFTILLDLPDSGKNAGHYKRNARRSFKNASYGDASLYAIEWLRAEDKERRKKKAYKFLKEALPESLIKLEEEINQMEADTATLEGKPLLEQLRQLKKHYLTLEEIKTRHYGLSNQWKIKQAGFREDYQSDLQPINRQLRTVIVQLAEAYYQKAQLLIEQDPKSRQDYLKIARVLKECRLYLPDYKDAADRFSEYKQKATARLAILPIQNQSNYEQLFTTPMQKSLYGELRQKLAASSLDFFELVPLEFSEVPEKCNIAFRLEIMSIQVQKKVNEPTETVRERAIANEKTKTERVIKGVLVTYSKEARVSIEAKYSMIDLESNEVLATEAAVSRDMITWSHTWYRCRGNCDALKKGERRYVKSSGKDKPYPNNVKLAQTAIENARFHNRLAEQILPFAKTHGQ